MILTPRDKEILRDLHRYGLHTTRGLASRHFPKVAITTVLRRLRILEAHGFIQRIFGLEDGGNAWALTHSGAQGFAPAASKIHFLRFILDHDLKLTAMRLRLEEAGIARSWRPEHEIRIRVARSLGKNGTKDRTIPDGLMGVEVSGTKETVAVELELSNKNQDRYRRIFRDYASKETLWGFWYVVGSATIGRQLAKAEKATWRGGKRPYFFWSLLEDVLRDPSKALMQNQKHRCRIGDLWKQNPVKAAHTPAQTMSTVVLENSSGKSGLTLDEDTGNAQLKPKEKDPPPPLATLPQHKL